MRLRAPHYAEGFRPPRLLTAARLAEAPSSIPVPPDPAKTQGFVMRGYDFTFTRYFALTVKDPAKARAFIASLISGEQAWPSVTIASPWAPPKPNRCLNLGFTYRGLGALGVPQPVLDSSFGENSDHYSFCLGAAAQAPVVGDYGPSDPSHWRLSDRDFDVMLILWGADAGIIDEDTVTLGQMIAGGFEDPLPARVFDSQAIADRKVWFGYKDGIAQPHVAGVPGTPDPDGGQQPVDPSGFMLGTSLSEVYLGRSVPTPPLGLHGCFGAFRILEQDVEGFEAMCGRLADADFRKRYGITDPAHAVEAVKALICGRWTNGVSLAVFPIQGDTPPPTILDNELNDFLYVLPKGAPDTDPTENVDAGSHCPISAHTRRGNMRGSPWAETKPDNAHRIIRRAASYQTPYAPDRPDTGERGLMGFFMGACLADQFEFVQQSWVNNPSGFSWSKDTTDPVMGVLQLGETDFFQTVGAPKDKLKLQGMASFVTTRAGAYCFFPGLDGIAALAAGAL